MSADEFSEIGRRQFLQGAAGAAVAVPAAPALAADPPAGAWFDRPMRWAQLVLVENDPGTFDLNFWLDYFRRVHADAACLSAGGVVAYYPTQVPLHHRSAWLKDADPFGDLVAGCRKLGMRILARTDPHAARQDVADAHPDWIAVDARGRKRRHWSNPDLWVTCALGPYNFEFMTSVHREIMTRYRVDGIFSNRWAGSGLCHCDHCRKDFGADLPRSEDPADPNWRKYSVWRAERLIELAKLWDAEIRKINPDARFVPNGLPTLAGAADLADILFLDRQGRSGVNPPWVNGLHAKKHRAVLGRKPIGGIFSVGLEEAPRWKDSVQSPAEIRVWVAEGIANGLRPWFVKFGGVLYDRRWLPVVEKIYQWHHTAERYLRNEAPIARVAVVYSEQTEKYYAGPPGRAQARGHEFGVYHALVEGRVPFEMVNDRRLTREYVDRYKLLVLPNVAALSDGQCRHLRDYVDRGGSLLATFETSLYDEWGVRRRDLGLADLFGVSYGGRVEGPMQNAYIRLTVETNHPLLAGFTDAQRIIHGVWRLDVQPRGPFPSPLTLIPSYPNLPMEDVYPRVPRTETREVYLRDLGRGRVVYFPWDIDRSFWEFLQPDHGTLLRNAVAWAANEEPPVRVTGPGLIDVTAWRQKDSLTVHLVNLTNPMLMKGPFRELVPLGEQQVKLRLLDGRRARKVQLLVGGESPRTSESGGWLTVTVPSVLDHEVVAVDL
jgi:hypothetical protein